MMEISPQVKTFFDQLCRDTPQVLFVRMNGGKPVHELRTYDDGLETLPMWNEVGWDCFYTVGVTDGSGYRRAENMMTPRALFVDLDNPTNAVAAKDFWLAQGNAPTAVVNTSPGKFHLYWFTEAGLDWPTWTYYQKLLAAWTNAKFGEKAADASVCDASRIMRLPGSLHHKADPYRGGVVSLNDRIYTLPELAAAFPKAPPSAPVKRIPHRDDTPLSKALIAEFKKLLTTLDVVKETDWGYVVTCPNASEHSTPGDEANLYAPSEKNGWAGGFICMHDHCKQKYGSPAIRKLRLLQAPVYEALIWRKTRESAALIGAEFTQRNLNRGAA